MEVLEVRGDSLSPQQMTKTLAVLERGGVVMHATETCYGFTADIFREDALMRLYDLKGMPLNKPLSIMATGLNDAERYGHFSKLAKRLGERYWPGPLTLIVPRKDTLPAFLNPESDTVGLRCPDHRLTFSFLKAMGTPLATTSANAWGEPELYSAKSLRLRPDLVIDSGEISHHLPSTVVKMKGGAGERPEIVRRGDLADDIEVFLRKA